MVYMFNRTRESEENRTVTPSGSRNSVTVSQVPQIDTSDDQPYYKHSFASQGSVSGLGHHLQEVLKTLTCSKLSTASYCTFCL